MSEEKISEISQNEDDKKDHEAIEMLTTKNQADFDHEKKAVAKNDSEKRVTIRRVFKLMHLNTV